MDYYDISNVTVFEIALHREYTELVTAIADDGPTSSKADLNRALFEATISGNVQAALSLLRAGADPYKKHDVGTYQTLGIAYLYDVRDYYK